MQKGDSSEAGYTQKTQTLIKKRSTGERHVFKEEDVEFDDDINCEIPDFDDKQRWLCKVEYEVAKKDENFEDWLNQPLSTVKHDGVLLNLLNDYDADRVEIDTGGAVNQGDAFENEFLDFEQPIERISAEQGPLKVKRPVAQILEPSKRTEINRPNEIDLSSHDSSILTSLVTHPKRDSTSSPARHDFVQQTNHNQAPPSSITASAQIGAYSMIDECFTPALMSTPSKLSERVHEDSKNDSAELNPCNVTDPGTGSGLNTTWTVGNTLLASISDPSILESVENQNPTLTNNKLNGTFTSNPNSNVNMREKELTFIYERDDDNRSTTSDGSYYSSSHIRSLGDVRTIARQQEESLMRTRPVMKKVLSDGSSINSNVMDTRTLSSIYGSTSQLNNNNSNNGDEFGSTSQFPVPLRESKSYTVLRGGRTPILIKTRHPAIPVLPRAGTSRDLPVYSPSRPLARSPTRSSARSRARSRASSRASSRIPRVSRIPTPSSRGSTNQRGNWRDGCY